MVDALTQEQIQALEGALSPRPSLAQRVGTAASRQASIVGQGLSAGAAQMADLAGQAAKYGTMIPAYGMMRAESALGIPGAEEKFLRMYDTPKEKTFAGQTAATLASMGADVQPSNFLERALQEVSEFAGGGGAMMGAAKALPAVRALAPQSARELAALSVGGGLGAQVAEDAFPNSVLAKMGGAMAGGAAMQAIPAAIKGATRAITGTPTKIGAEDKAYKIAARALLDENLKPDDVTSMANAASQRGLGETLPEFTQSQKLLNYYKEIAKGGGAAGRKLNEAVRQRVTPGAADDVATVQSGIKRFADKMIANRVEADRLYKSTLGTQVDDAITQRVRSVPSVQSIEKSMLADDTLARDLTRNPPGTLGYLKLIQKKMRETASSVAKDDRDKARRINELSNEVSNILYQASPDLKTADNLYAKFAAGREIKDIVDATKDHTILTLKGKLYGTEKVRDAITKNMSIDEKQGFDDLMDGLDNIARGTLSGSDTATRQAVQKELAQATGSPALGVVENPVSAPRRLVGFLQDKLRSKDYDAIADVLMSPDLGKLGRAMQQEKASALDAFAKNILQGSAQAGRVGARAGLQGGAPEEAPPPPELSDEQARALDALFAQPALVQTATPALDTSNIPVGAVNLLISRPDLARDFDAMYGNGASDVILQQLNQR